MNEHWICMSYEFRCEKESIQQVFDILKECSDVSVRHRKIYQSRLSNGSVGANFALRRTQNLLRGTCSKKRAWWKSELCILVEGERDEHETYRTKKPPPPMWGGYCVICFSFKASGFVPSSSGTAVFFKSYLPVVVFVLQIYCCLIPIKTWLVIYRF